MTAACAVVHSSNSIQQICVFISFLVERQRSPSVHLVHRRGGTPCWLHLSWLLLAPAQNRFRVVRALRVFSGGRSVVRALTIIFLANVSVQVRRLVRRNLQRLVGIFVLAVHALDLSEIVAARSMLFAGGWWRIHFTCGSPYIPIPTSAFTLGAPCAP